MVFIHTKIFGMTKQVSGIQEYLLTVPIAKALVLYPDYSLILQIDTDDLPPDYVAYICPNKKIVNNLNSDKLSFTFIGDEMEVTWVK